MKPWEILGRAHTPDGSELILTRHPSEFLILVGHEILMSSRTHGSETALGTIGCRLAGQLTQPFVLVGGLGMGFTLRAALDALPPDARVIVAELVPAVVEWNRGPLGALAAHPLDDPRVRLEEGDVGAAMRSRPAAFDAVLLDVDNGPSALTSAENVSLYDDRGLAVARASLKRDGVLALWSARDDRQFERRLRAAGFTVTRERVTGRQRKGGPKHTVVLARRNASSEDPGHQR